MNTLSELYKTHHEQLKQFALKFPDKELSGPFLLDVDAYFNQPKKLVIVAQETRDWFDDCDSVEAQMAEYRKFNVGQNYNSPIYQLMRKFEVLLGNEPFSTALTNLNRFDQNRAAPVGEVLEALPTLDFLVREEIQILQPEVCIFHTNRRYDGRLLDLYPGLQFEDVDGLPPNHFAKLVHDQLPKTSLRTPHPRWINQAGLGEKLLAALSLLSR